MGSSGGGSSAPATQTVTQVQSIPPFQQAQIQRNEQIANSLGAQPFPVYQAPIVASLNPTEQAGLANTVANAYNYQPYLTAASNSLAQSNGLTAAATANSTPQIGAAVNSLTGAAASMNPVGGVTNSVNALQKQNLASNPVPGATAGVNGLTSAMLNDNPANAAYMQSLMSPYVQQALAPQILQANQNLAQQQNQINAGAAQAGAYGGARQGAENALQNYYGQQTLGGIEAQGYNQAYNQALGTATTEQGLLNQAANAQLGLGQLGLGEQSALSQMAQNQLNLGGLGVNEQNALNNLAGTQLNLGTLGQNQAKLAQSQEGINISQAAAQAALGQQAQTQGLNAGQAIYNAGNVAQQNQQQQLTAAYQQYLNQINWAPQMLNLQMAAVNSSPYSMSNSVTVPQANSGMQGLSSFLSAAGLLGGLTGH